LGLPSASECVNNNINKHNYYNTFKLIKGKKMKLLKLSAVAALTCALSISAQADDSKPKRELKNNMMVKTNITPKAVDNIKDAFGEGMFYGRLRANAFKWDWKNETTKTKDNKAFGLGGSMLYKTAPLMGLSAMAGLYYTSSPFSGLREDAADVGFLKAGKDTISRYQVANGGAWSYAVLAQANIEYKYSKTKFKAGRQIFESFLTKSNDTKMIPNTFMGYTLETKELANTRIRGAYFTAQKLRDHTTFHDVITFKDGSGSTYSKWNNNDDSAAHKGLSYTNFVTAGKDVNHELIVVDFKNKSIDNLQVDVTYGAVPDVVSSITGELNYKIALGDGYTLTPGVRYMKQMDDGGGAIGGATLKGKLAIDKSPTTNLGYKERYTLDSSLWMARLVLKKGPIKVKLGYSAVEDAADIVAPWRGFPTGGYTRAMAQYNWYANTKTWNIEANYDFDKAGLVSGFSAMARYAIQNFDEAKQAAGVQADSKILHMDFRENFGNGLYAKVRVGLVSADSRVGGIDQDSYNEYRFELNYLF
jgi:hypothetical protein